MEHLELIQFLPRAGQLDRFAGDGLQAEGRATASVAIQFCQDGTGDVQRLIKMRRHIHRFLAGGGIEHEQNFLRLNEVAQTNQFLHERAVNLQTSGGVEDKRIAIIRLGEFQRAPGDF